MVDLWNYWNNWNCCASEFCLWNGSMPMRRKLIHRLTRENFVPSFRHAELSHWTAGQRSRGAAALPYAKGRGESL
jgi:hypothetical protein